ncbi:hypothetical protein [Anaerospora hongkongensis]|uniref:hypothetical protein n=1 Tax=Anaerospora hongkongensis TaxID=244830 RepID=UPI00289B508C|nr:hypothetical protein [Anaerospora hongkongensis]
MNTKEALNQEQIEEWKAQYGRIFKTTIGDDVVIWRKLKRREYVHIMSQEATDGIAGDKVYARQDLIVAAVALYPENIKDLIADNAGLATCVADEVILKSGFDITDTQEL